MTGPGIDGLEIAYRRLANQHVSGSPLPDPVAVVAHHGAMQAQEYAVAKWSVGQRTTGVTDTEVQAAIDDGRILRTHALRPTWHFIAARDIGWIQALTGPRVHAFNAYYYRTHQMDDAFAATTNALITGALRGGNYLTRKELAAVLAGAGIEATGNKLAYIVLRAELDGLIANGPMRAKQHTYALISERAPDAITLTPDEALAELTRRYFASHGPATVKDFAWWSSLTQSQIKKGLALVGSGLESFELDGLRFWYAPAPAPPPPPRPDVSLLQGYDEYFVAYTATRWVSNLAGRELSAPNENTLVHAVTVDSQVRALWRRIVEPKRQLAELTVNGSLTATQRKAVEKAFGRYAAFTGVPVTIAWP